MDKDRSDPREEQSETQIKWYSIKDAPLDGTIVDLWAGNKRIIDCWYDLEYGWVYGFHFYHDKEVALQVTGTITHYMIVRKPWT